MGRKQKGDIKKRLKKHFQTANKQFTSMMYSRGKDRQAMVRYKAGQRVLRITDKQRENETLSVDWSMREAFPALVTKTKRT